MARAVSVLAAALLPTCALGHGYVQTPASRGWGCMRDNGQLQNTNCGQVQWEAWSVEGLDGTPRYPAQAANGIPDGRLASANRPRDGWGQLDEQSATRWDKVQLSSGMTEFRWVFVAPHATRDFRYWITKPDWNPEAPLTRATFEDEPFCTVELQGALADSNPNHMCNVPTRKGYHVVLAVWDVSDTANSFYNVIDAIVDGTAAPPTTTAPGASTAAPACSSTAGAWGNCHQPGTCCPSGWTCARQSQWYSQCLPEDQATTTVPPPTYTYTTAPPATTTTVPPTTTAVPPATTTAVPPATTTVPSVCKAYDECTSDAGCCQAGLECVAVCDTYSQCRPRSQLPPAPAGCTAAVAEYGACKEAPGCCVGWTVCVQVSPYYSQCLRPEAP